MEKIFDSLLQFIKGISKVVWFSLLGIVALLIAGMATFGWLNKDNTLAFTVDQRIDITPQQIQSIEEIGQWEFLAINDEEIVDSIKKHFFIDAELVRIYYGTLRLGIDLKKAKPHWLRVENDSVVVATLPPIELLDSTFIDETRSQSFFQDGTWKPEERQGLYQTAYKKMLSYLL